MLKKKYYLKVSPFVDLFFSTGSYGKIFNSHPWVFEEFLNFSKMFSSSPPPLETIIVKYKNSDGSFISFIFSNKVLTLSSLKIIKNYNAVYTVCTLRDVEI